MPKGCPVISAPRRETMMLGEVPTRVIRPPKSDPKAIGIRKHEGEAFDRRAIWNATGIITPTRRCSSPGAPSGTRRGSSRQRADVLHEGGQDRDSCNEKNDLGLHGHDVGRHVMQHGSDET